jgi:hypothetical protein
MAGPEVGRPPLHRTHDEVPVPDDGGYPVLHKPVPKRDVGPRQAHIHKRPEGGLQVRGLEGDEGEVERVPELARVGVGIEPDAALRAQVVEEEAGLP